MALARIKEEHKHKRVAFGKSAAPLHKRTDIDDLAIIALESKSPSLIKLFDYLPELSLLKKAKTESELKRPTTKEVVPSSVISVDTNKKNTRTRKRNANNK